MRMTWGAQWRNHHALDGGPFFLQVHWHLTLLLRPRRLVWIFLAPQAFVSLYLTADFLSENRKREFLMAMNNIADRTSHTKKINFAWDTVKSVNTFSLRHCKNGLRIFAKVDKYIKLSQRAKKARIPSVNISCQFHKWLRFFFSSARKYFARYLIFRTRCDGWWEWWKYFSSQRFISLDVFDSTFSASHLRVTEEKKLSPTCYPRR